MFSTSIMDYNDFEIERAAFSDVNSADGPLLEYDRQMMSTLYNFDADHGRGKDVSDSDALVPACNDAEADNEDGGVNPTCIRYDIEKDPTASITTATRRIEEAQVAGDITLSQALGRIADLALPTDRMGEGKNRDDVDALAKRYEAALLGAMDFYIVSDVASLDRTVRTNVKSLLELNQEKNEKLPEGYSAAQMRERVFAGIQKVMSMNELPASPKKALEDAIQAGAARLAATPYALGLTPDQRNQLTADLIKTMTAGTLDQFIHDPKLGKPKPGQSASGPVGLILGRAKVLASLARHPNADFFVGAEANAQVDYEKNIASLLADVVVDQNRAAPERIAAASALGSYQGRPSGTALDAIMPKLTAERAAAATNDARHTIEAILKALTQGPAS
jgi:hypothetical protein